jgi:hypothetical protein
MQNMCGPSAHGRQAGAATVALSYGLPPDPTPMWMLLSHLWPTQSMCQIFAMGDELLEHEVPRPELGPRLEEQEAQLLAEAEEPPRKSGCGASKVFCGHGQSHVRRCE